MPPKRDWGAAGMDHEAGEIWWYVCWFIAIRPQIGSNFKWTTNAMLLSEVCLGMWYGVLYVGFSF